MKRNQIHFPPLCRETSSSVALAHQDVSTHHHIHLRRVEKGKEKEQEKEKEMVFLLQDRSGSSEDQTSCQVRQQ
jgi:hypothetical protein